MNVTENELKRIIAEEIMRGIEKRLNEESEAHATVLNKDFHEPILVACMILAWKGLKVDLCVGGPSFEKMIRQPILVYRRKLNEARAKGGKEGGEAFREEWKTKHPKLAGIVETEKKAMTMFNEFRTEAGFNFISKFEGGKKKVAGFAIFGQNDGTLNEREIKNGAMMVIRDFFVWDAKGRPALAGRFERKAVATGEKIRGTEFDEKARRGDEIGIGSERPEATFNPDAAFKKLQTALFKKLDAILAKYQDMGNDEDQEAMMQKMREMVGEIDMAAVAIAKQFQVKPSTLIPYARIESGIDQNGARDVQSKNVLIDDIKKALQLANDKSSIAQAWGQNEEK